MDFGALPPEINSARMYSGPGSGPILAAATAWNAVAAELNSAAASYGTVVARLTNDEWLGSASTEMLAAATPYVAWMNTAGAQAEQTANQAQAAAAAYEQAFAMTVPPPLVTANRVRLQQLVTTNVLGENTAAIAATEAQYGEMWAQDAAAMYGYAGHAAVATDVKPFKSPPPTTTAAGPATQAAAVSQASASKALASTPNALQALASPAATTAPAASATTTTPPVSLAGLDTIAKSPTLSAANSTYSNFIHTANFGARGICSIWRGLSGGLGAAKQLGSGAAKAAAGAAKAAAGAGHAAASLGAVSPVAGSIGHAGSVGALSVPPSWAPAAPAAKLTGFVSGGTWEPVGGSGLPGEASAAPGMPGMPATGLAGRAAGFGAQPRYGLKPVVMPRIPGLG